MPPIKSPSVSLSASMIVDDEHVCRPAEQQMSPARQSGSGPLATLHFRGRKIATGDALTLKKTPPSGPEKSARDDFYLPTPGEALTLAASIRDGFKDLEKSALGFGGAGLDTAGRQTALEMKEVVDCALAGGSATNVTNPAAVQVANAINASVKRLETSTQRKLSPEQRSVAVLDALGQVAGVIDEASVQHLKSSGRGELTAEQRKVAILDALGRVAKENGTEAVTRWGQNIGVTAVRTGLIVGILTTLRQAVGFSAERALRDGGVSQGGRAAIGTGLSLLGPALNIIGAVRDEVRGTATSESRAARGQMAVVGAAGIGAMFASGTQGISPGFMLQASTYTLARDIAQAFLPLKSNSERMMAPAVSTAQTAYGINQFLVSEAMDYLAPVSGAGAALTRDNAVTDWRQNAVRGSINGLGEVADDLTLNTVNRRLEVDGNRELIRTKSPALLDRLSRVVNEAEDAGSAKGLTGLHLNNYVRRAAVAEVAKMTQGLRLWVKPRIPTITQFLDQMLTTSAMRTSAFNTTYAVATAASSVIGKGVSNDASNVLTSMLVGGVLSYIYAPFLNAHDQRPAAPSTSSGEIAQAGGARRRQTERSEGSNQGIRDTRV